MRVLGKRIRQLSLVLAFAMIAFLIIAPGYVEKTAIASYLMTHSQFWPQPKHSMTPL